MAAHKPYSAIIQAIKAGKLNEPFSKEEFRRACPGLGVGTYNAFLYKHRKENPGGASELFEMIAKDKFQILRPYRYGK